LPRGGRGEINTGKMFKFKTKNLSLIILFAIFGLTYFSAISNLEINLILKNYLAIIPLQILALFYVGYFYNNCAQNPLL
jgi:hypothetical protein